MPLYNTSSTATALGISQKWLDNLLSHNKIGGIQQARQGISRRLSLDGVMTIAIVHALSDDIGIPVRKGIALAERLLEAPENAIAISGGIRVGLDRGTLERSVLDGLAHAVEVTPLPARGRPGPPGRPG